MINPIETYRDAGRKAAEARNDKDSARAEFHHNWYNKARRLEAYDDRPLADKAFNDAYLDARNIGKPEYFK